MKFNLWHRNAMRPLMLRITPVTIATFVGTMTLLASAGGAIGYAIGAKNNQTTQVVVNQTSATPTITPKQQLELVNNRVAEMQAQLIRLDALTQHMAESARVPVREFSLESNPKGAKGGPLLEQVSVLGEDNIDMRLQELSQLIEEKENQLRTLDNLLTNKRIQNNQNYLANLPVRDGSITSQFGYRSDPFNKRVAFHAGMDFSGPHGANIYAVASGIVSFAGVKNGYGNVIEISHGNGYVTRYAHAYRLAAKQGDLVSKDQVVAYMGSTGRSTGTHLHYEVIVNGKQIDPMSFVSVALKK
ncbi:MAG: M23 family metallopeptidase [Agitococcus sp.]